MRQQIVQNFERAIGSKVFLINRCLTEHYNRFPKQDANELCTKQLRLLLLKYDLLVPWNVFVLDADQEVNKQGYIVHNCNIEVVFMFKLSDTEIVQVSLDAWTPELLVEYKVLQDNKWEMVCDNYSMLQAADQDLEINDLSTPLLDSVRHRVQPRLMWQ